MRVMLRIAIALPIATIFCLAYLVMLALEARRDSALAPWATRNVRLPQSPWTGPAATHV